MPIEPKPTRLPPREPASEDAFVAGWREQNVDEDELLEVIVHVIEAGRPQLGARLVGLLTPRPDEPPAVARARAAARLLLREGGVEAEQALAEELTPLRGLLVHRSRARHRAQLMGLPTPRRRR